MVSSVFIGVGSNVRPEVNIPKALRLLMKSGCIDHASSCPVALSTHYRTKALNRENDPEFVNGVWMIRTHFSLRRIRSLLKRIETSCGRKRSSDPFDPRTIDLDILLFGETADKGAKLPHPDIYRRPFVYVPLIELAPDLIPPGDKEKLASVVDSSAGPMIVSPLTGLLQIELTAGDVK